MPWELVFSNLPILQHEFYIGFDYVVDVIFIIDVIIMFWTTFSNRKGKEVWNQGEIARNYVTTMRFYTDILAILGGAAITSIFEDFKVLGLFKLSRILRIRAFVKTLNIDVETKTFISLVRLIIEVLLFIHI